MKKMLLVLVLFAGFVSLIVVSCSDTPDKIFVNSGSVSVDADDDMDYDSYRGQVFIPEGSPCLYHSVVPGEVQMINIVPNKDDDVDYDSYRGQVFIPEGSPSPDHSVAPGKVSVK